MKSSRARSSIDSAGLTGSAGGSSSVERLEVERRLGRFLFGLGGGLRLVLGDLGRGAAARDRLGVGDRRLAAAGSAALRRPFFGAGASAALRFSRSQRTRTAATWSGSSADMWLRTKMFISRSMPMSCSTGTPNSAARSCTLLLTTHSSVNPSPAPLQR